MKLREAHFMKLNSSAFRAKDDRLLKMALQGDQKALDLRFARYRRLLYDLALRILRNHEEAEDAVQSCLLLAYRNLSNV
jgi:RNA polymerase sigma-70 factor (ECF subfamily)